MFNNSSNQSASSTKGSVAPATGSSRTPAGSTPPTAPATQTPSVSQPQQPPQPSHYYANPALYGLPFHPQLVGHHSHHPHPLPHQPGAPGEPNAANASGGGNSGASALIDPMLSTMSDGGEGMSDDEGVGGNGGGSGGVKNGPPSAGGNNGINTHQLEDDDYHGDDGDGHPLPQDDSHPGGAHIVVPPSPVPLDENGQPVKKKRRRQALSCTECKRRKIKCDRQNPCSPCSRRGEADRCRWITQEPIDKFVSRSEFEALQQKVMQLEAILAGLHRGAFIGGLEHLGIAPPPFPFAPPHQGYGAPPPQQPSNGAPYPPEQLQAYAAIVAAAEGNVHPPPHFPNKPQQPSSQEEGTTEVQPGADPAQAEPSTLPPASKPPKSRKRKERHKEGAEDPTASPNAGAPAKVRTKQPRPPKAPAVGQTTWDPTTAAAAAPPAAVNDGGDRAMDTNA